MCSLQEAYQIPSFSSAVKKKCLPQPVADPFDPFSPEIGRGEKAMYKPEGFSNKNRSTTEGFTTDGQPSRQQLGLRDNVSYASQATDYDYYCRTYGVCTTPPNRPIPQPNPDVPTTGKLEGFTTQGTCKYGSQNMPLRYEYPISPEAKEAYKRAVDTSLAMDEKATATIPIEAQMRKEDLSDLKGFEDEDLDKYLQTKDMKAAPMIPISAPVHPQPQAVPYDPKESPFAKAIQHFSKEENKLPQVIKENMAAEAPSVINRITAPLIPQSSPNGDKIWDMLLFVFIGLLIIFLCDQLLRLGIMLGMRRTVQLLEPFLEKA